MSRKVSASYLWATLSPFKCTRRFLLCWANKGPKPSTGKQLRPIFICFHLFATKRCLRHTSLAIFYPTPPTNQSQNLGDHFRKVLTFLSSIVEFTWGKPQIFLMLSKNLLRGSLKICQFSSNLYFGGTQLLGTITAKILFAPFQTPPLKISLKGIAVRLCRRKMRLLEICSKRLSRLPSTAHCTLSAVCTLWMPRVSRTEERIDTNSLREIGI
mmetsp:Transcript_34226/g.69976  ORF Transcript_34226/g.69976 Transcript_34226/m.69976 type:complete len:213 (-) Transcript_34226:208-846(-)